MKNEPLWRSPERTIYAPLHHDLVVDVLIIGAGITGLTLALALRGMGRTVAVVDMRSVGAGATGHSTGHLTTALDVDYRALLRRFGALGALEAAAKSQAAIRFIEDTVTTHAIPCGFRRADGWRYAGSDPAGDAFPEELDAARSVGIPVELVEAGPLPLMGRALRFLDQAMLDPAAYVNALARITTEAGVLLYEDTRVEKVLDGDPCRVEAGGFVIEARTVVEATHVPVSSGLAFQARLAPYLSYVLAVRIDGPLPPDLYWDTQRPYHYLRGATAPDGTEVVLAGGEDHKVGQEPDPESRYAALEQYVRARFRVLDVEWRWAFEVFEPADGLPYVGRPGRARNVYAATGFAGTGLTFGTAAALDIAGQLSGAPGWASVFRTQRYTPIASARNFLTENANVTWRMLRDQLATVPEGGDLQPGEGRLTRVDGERVAAYRTPAGRLQLLSPFCTHAGGLLQWNSAASTWDCPLHGSRFLADGAVLSGPACTPLPPGGHLEPGRECSVPDLIAEWQEQGYTCELHADDDGRVGCRDPGHQGQENPGVIEAFHRFEGMSDPGDTCVVVAMRIPRDDGEACRGVMVLGFGPSASPEEINVLDRLEFAEDARLAGTRPVKPAE